MGRFLLPSEITDPRPPSNPSGVLGCPWDVIRCYNLVHVMPIRLAGVFGVPSGANAEQEWSSPID